MTDKNKSLDNRHVAHWELQPGFVYFIAAGKPTEAVKIGISTQSTMIKRLRSDQSSNHQPLEILGLVLFEGMEKPMAEANSLEVSLHEKFQSLRRFTSGPGNEWFTLNRELLDHIKDHTDPPGAHDLVSTVAKVGPGLDLEDSSEVL